MTHTINPVYFTELRKRDPEEICRNALCSFDITNQSYILSFMDDGYIINPETKSMIRQKDKSRNIDILEGLTIIYYLLYAKEIRIKGEWISEKDIPGGGMFFTGPHTIPTDMISRKFVNIEEFTRRVHELSGRTLEMGDSACSLRVLPRVPVALIYWKGDDEYPVQTRMLFDRSISEHLSLDVIFGMTVTLCRKFCE